MTRFAHLAATFGVAATLGLAAPAIAQDEDSDTPEMTEGERELAEMLEGRVPGEPQSCVRTFASRGFEVIDKTALVIREGGTIWVNFTRNPRSLDENDYLVIRKFGTSPNRLCRLDNVTTRDRGSNFYSGNVFLEDFIPYREVEETEFDG
ncbi:hypothetical protein [Parapontixanthobacter aurantiacus]|nr:hypothetical protein [Parapontixanthobacter aurantiacus]